MNVKLHKDNFNNITTEDIKVHSTKYRRIQKPVKHMRWNFLTKSHQLLPQKVPS